MVLKVPKPILLAMLFAAAVAQATTLLALDVPSLTKASSAVVRATVRSNATRWTNDGGRIMTDTVLEVTESWKGTPGKYITVMQPGGVIGDIGQIVHGTVKFTPGEDVVLFLEPRGDNFLLTGMMQGKFWVEATSSGKTSYVHQSTEAQAALVDPLSRQRVHPEALVLPIEKLRSQVLAVSGARLTPEPHSPGPVKVTP